MDNEFCHVARESQHLGWGPGVGSCFSFPAMVTLTGQVVLIHRGLTQPRVQESNIKKNDARSLPWPLVPQSQGCLF
jgi:hypothetical protein